MKTNRLRKNKIICSIAAFAFFLLQSNFIYAWDGVHHGGNSQNALPQGHDVVTGEADFTYSHHHHELDINTVGGTVIDWNSYNIGRHDTVNYILPVIGPVINWVTGINPSRLIGTLESKNGEIFIINPNGIVFGPHSQIDVNSFLASTLDISQSDFLAGKFNFTQNGKSSYIINKGNIHVANGGYVLLLSNAIDNSGVIAAKLGRVLLATGEKMTVALDDDSDISVTVDDAVSNNVFGPDGKKIEDAIENTGTIKADGGEVLLNANVLNGIFNYAINNAGVIQANSLVNHNGTVELVSSGGNIVASAGSVTSAKAADATAQGGHVKFYADGGSTNIEKGAVVDVSGGSLAGDAGSIEFSGTDGVGLHSTDIYTNAAAGFSHGSVTIDPQDIIIALGGSDVPAGDNPSGTPDESYTDDPGDTLFIDPAVLESLTASEVYLQATRNIFIDSQVTLNTSFRLDAGNNININNAVVVNNGDVNFNAGNQLTMSNVVSNPGSITTNGGNINLTSNGTMTISNLTTNGTGDVNLQSNNSDVNLGVVSAAGHTVTIGAGGGINNNAGSSTTNVTAENLSLGAHNGIGASQALNTNVSNLYISNLIGNVNIVNASALTLTNQVGSQLLGGNVTSVETWVTGDDSITASSIYIDNPIIDAGTGNLTLTATTGSISSAPGANITSENANLSAVTGIDLTGSNNVFGSLNASVSGTGNLDFNNSSALTVTNASTANGHVNITSNGTMNAQNVTTNGTGDVDLQTNAGDINLGTVSAAGHTATVSAAGNINNAAGSSATNVTAKNLILGASGSIGAATALNTAVSNMYINNISGNVNVNNSLDLTLTNSFDGGPAFGNPASIDNWFSGSDSITARSITIDAPILSKGTLTLTATSGGISGVSITAFNANLSAVTGIDLTGSNNVFGSLNASVSGTGNLDFNNSSALTVTNASTANGHVNITSNGTMNAQNVTTNGTGDVDLQTNAGDINLGTVSAAGHTATVSAAGNINNAAGSSATNVTAKNLILGASGSIGAATALNTAVSNMYINNISGNVNVNNSLDLTLTNSFDGGPAFGNPASIDNWFSGSDSITARSITIDAPILSKGTLTLTATSGGISGVSITAFNADLTAVTGIDLTGSNNVFGGLTASVSGTGDLDFNDANDLTLSNITTQNGNINITANGNIFAGIVQAGTGTNSNNNVTLTATTGSILDNGSSITGNYLDLTAATGIGSSSNALNTSALSVDAVVNGTGLINLNNSGGIDLDHVETANGSINVTSGGIFANDVVSDTDAAGNDITLTANNNGGILVGTISDGPTTGNVTLKATTGAISGYPTSLITGNDLNLTAATGIGTGVVALNTSVNTIDANVTGYGLIYLNNTGAVTLDNVQTTGGPITVFSGGTITAKKVTSLLSNSSNTITLTASAGDVDLGSVNAGNQGTAYITATNGAINNTNSGLANNITAQNIGLSALNGIGSSKAIQVSASNLDAFNTNNDIKINASKSLALTNSFNGPAISNTNGNVDITVLGSLTVNEAVVDDLNSVTLTSLGSIVNGNGTTGTITANDLTLSALSGIGSSSPMETAAANLQVLNLTGNVNIANTGALNLTNLNGSGYAVTGGLGSVNISADSPLTVSSAVTAGKNITLSALASPADDDNLTVNANVTSLNSGLITLNAGASFVQNSGTISTKGNAAINASGDDGQGTITQNGGTVNANQLSLGAVGGITMDQANKVKSLVANVTSTGSISFNNNAGLTLTDVTTANGGITVTANGTINAEDVDSSATDAAGNDVSLTANTGDINVGTVNAGATTGSIYLTATNGSILDNGSSISGNYLDLTAANGIGTGVALNTTVNTIDASVTGAGLIDLNSTGAVDLDDVTTANGGITVTANGTITANDVDSSATDAAGNDVSLTANTGDIDVGTVNAGATTGSIYLTATNGSILDRSSSISGNYLDLTAANGIGTGGALNTTANSIDASVSGTGDIELNNVNTSSGGVLLDDLTTANGSINVTADGNIDVGTVNAGAWGVYLGASNGTIDDLTGNSLVTGNYVTFVAANGIGVTNVINTTANNLSGTVTGIGGIYLNNENTASGGVTINGSNNDDINVTADGTINVGTVNAGNGDVTLTTTNGGSILDAGSSVTGGTINLNSAGDIGSSTAALNTDSDFLNVTAAGNAYLNSTGVEIQNLNVTGSADITSNGGVILDSVTTGGDFDLTEQTGDITINGTTQSTGGDVSLTSDLGAINANTGSLVEGNTVSLTAAQGIGSTVNAVNTTANTISASVTGTGGAYLNNLNTAPGGVTVSSLTTNNGDITFSADGTINVGTVNAGSSNVSLTATNGGSLVDDGSSITGNLVTLSADGAIGSSTTPLNTTSNSLSVTNTGTGNVFLNSTNGTTLDNVTTNGEFSLTALNGSINGNPGSTVTAGSAFLATPNGTMGLTNAVNVNITGPLVLDIGASGSGFDSGILTGSVNNGGIPTFSPVSYPSPLIPPGNVYFNGVRIWPSNTAFAASQASTGLLNHFVFPSAEKLAQTQVNTFDPSTSASQSGGAGLFLYHPLTQLDSGAFDQEFQLDEGAYDYIDGRIQRTAAP